MRECSKGPLCAVCKNRYYRMGQECIKCNGSTRIFTVIGLIVGIIIFGAFFLLAMNYSNVVGKVVEEAHKSDKDASEEISGENVGGRGGYTRGLSTTNFGLGLADGERANRRARTRATRRFCRRELRCCEASLSCEIGARRRRVELLMQMLRFS